jgi:hypothetical protein
MNLQAMVEQFVRAWAPHGKTAERERELFIVELRALLNAYADGALTHGARPEKGTPHGSGRGRR